MALGLAQEGWTVVVHYHGSEQAAQETASEIELAGGQAHLLRADLATEQETSELLPRAVAEAGPLGCLINNASLFEYDDINTATAESWNGHMNVTSAHPSC